MNIHKAILLLGFVSGGTINMCIMSLRIDLKGQDAYIEYVKNNWVSSSITIPLAIVVGLIGVFGVFTCLNFIKKMQDIDSLTKGGPKTFDMKLH